MNHAEILSSGPDFEEFERLLKIQFDVTKPGELVEGKVVNVGRDYVTVDIGFKSDGIIPIAQFQDHEGKIHVQTGDMNEVMQLASEHEPGENVL